MRVNKELGFSISVQHQVLFHIESKMAFELCGGNDLTRGISSFSFDLYQVDQKLSMKNITKSNLKIIV